MKGLSGATNPSLVNSPIAVRRLMFVHGPLVYRLLGKDWYTWSLACSTDCFLDFADGSD
jgi:hypothetical protein